MIFLSTLVDLCFKAVAFTYLILWVVPGLSESLGVDLMATASVAVPVLALLGLLRPKLFKLALPAMAERAMRKRKPR